MTDPMPMPDRPWWLLKTEPGEFSIDDLAARGREPWTGVRNYQARNYLRDAMAPGDGVLLYHSSCPQPGVAGIARVLGPAYPDPTQFDPASDYHDPASPPGAPRWYCLDIGHQRKLRRVIGRPELAALPELAGHPLLSRGNRLSVLPLSSLQACAILACEEE